MNPAQPDLVEYPKIVVAGETHELRLTCGTILRLKGMGIDLFAQPPYDKQAVKSTVLYQNAAAIGADGAPVTEEQEKQRAHLYAEAAATWELASPARKAWEHPLEVSDNILRMENCFKVVAACLSTKKKPLTFEDIADEVPIGQDLADIMLGVAIAAKKALSQIANVRTPSVAASIQ